MLLCPAVAASQASRSWPWAWPVLDPLECSRTRRAPVQFQLLEQALQHAHARGLTPAARCHATACLCRAKPKPVRRPVPSRSRDVCCGAQVVYPSVSREQMLNLLREHLRANLVRINGRWHYQRRGIPQVTHTPCLTCSRPYSAMPPRQTYTH